MNDSAMDLSASTSSRASSSTTIKRPRASRLDPSFLKTRGKGSALGSLAENDEYPVSEMRPLTDMNFNRMATSDDSSSSTERIVLPKTKDRHHGSPGKRMPSHVNRPGPLSASTNKPLSSVRRRSNATGPVRIEKSRRRSSMIPQLSPPQQDGAGAAPPSKSSVSARRIMIASPTKRPQRSSLTRGSSARMKPLPALNFGVPPTSLGDLSADISISKGGGSRPTWR